MRLRRGIHAYYQIIRAWPLWPPFGRPFGRLWSEEVKGLTPVRGYRGMSKGDCVALAKTGSAFSQLGYIDSIVEAEISLLIVKKESEGDLISCLTPFYP